mmetsp:Transcript_16340/g.51351  ORF Transcript_16340/g.51351 Transcript_16340/m.51351 type:complete len:276 (-) Transcript_16340:937-1764(-)
MPPLREPRELELGRAIEEVLRHLGGEPPALQLADGAPVVAVAPVPVVQLVLEAVGLGGVHREAREVLPRHPRRPGGDGDLRHDRVHEPRVGRGGGVLRARHVRGADCDGVVALLQPPQHEGVVIMHEAVPAGPYHAPLVQPVGVRELHLGAPHGKGRVGGGGEAHGARQDVGVGGLVMDGPLVVRGARVHVPRAVHHPHVQGAGALQQPLEGEAVPQPHGVLQGPLLPLPPVQPELVRVRVHELPRARYHKGRGCVLGEPRGALVDDGVGGVEVH